MNVRLFAITVIFIFCQLAMAQEKVMLIRQHSSQGFSVYDNESHLLFTLPPKDIPAVKEEWEPYFLGDFYLVDFSTGTLPVKTENGFYLVNRKGQTIRKFSGEYWFVSMIQNNYFYVSILLADHSTLFQYYDGSGQPVFGGKKYWNGGAVIDEIALVQYYQEGVESIKQDGDWVLIKKDGSVLKNISAEVQGKISRFYRRFPNQWNLSVTGGKSSEIFITPDGNILNQAFYYDKVNTRQCHNCMHYSDSLANAQNLPFKKYFTTWPSAFINGNLFFIRDISDSSPKTVLLDRDFKPIELKKDNHVVFPVEFFGDYVLTVERINGENISFPLFDLRTKSLNAVLKDWPDKADSGFLIFFAEGSSKLFPKVEKVLNMKGLPIFELDISKRVVKDIDEAMSNRDKIKMMELNSPDSVKLISLGEFKNLELFELKRYQARLLPLKLFHNWLKLKTLEISYCESLTSLPESMKELKLLEKLTILSCDHLKGIEEWLALWPSLKSIKTDLPIALETRKKYPNILFEETLVELKE